MTGDAADPIGKMRREQVQPTGSARDAFNEKAPQEKIQQDEQHWPGREILPLDSVILTRWNNGSLTH